MNALESLTQVYENLKSKDNFNFNIFQILKLEYDEVRLHSGILKFYIENDPDGFLRAIPEEYWIQKLKPGKDEFENVLVEEPIYSSVESVGDGRIDLLIRFKSFLIIIENKIHAKDQVQQLVKYHNYGASCKNDFLLLYLTPNGLVPDDISITPVDFRIPKLQLNKNFHIISYKEHILAWLKQYIDGHKENNTEQIILKQYIETVKKICGIMDEKQKKRIHYLLNKQELTSRLSIIKNDIQLIENKIHDFWYMVALKSEKELSVNFKDGVSAKEGSIMFDLFGKGRGFINLYLEYKPNFEETPYIGIWLHSNYVQNLQTVIEKHRLQLEKGFISKVSLKDFFDEKVILNYMEGNCQGEMEKIVMKIRDYTDINADLIQDIRQQLNWMTDKSF